ncbi:MAG: tyrosine-type recombinase/integrase [Alphaproteobacteria bacterium]
MPRKASQPWIETRGDQFYVFWYDAALKRTRRRSLGTSDGTAAQVRFAAFLTESHRVAREVKPDGLTVGTALDLYYNEHVLAKRGDGTDKVIDQHRIRAIIANLKAHFDVLPVICISQPVVDAYLQRRRTGDIQIGTKKLAGDGTLLREMSCLRVAINHNVRRQRLASGSVPHFDLPQAPPPKERWLTPAEAKTLLAAAADITRRPPGQDVDSPPRLSRLYRFVMIALYTGARKSAIQDLMWSQVDFVGGYIAFNRPGQRQSKKRKPTVPMAAELRRMLETAFAEKQSLYVLDHDGETKTAFRNAIKRAGMASSGVTRHSLRHTFATWALQRGIAPWKVAGVLGDTHQTVMRTYAHHIPRHLVDAVDFSVDSEVIRDRSAGSDPGA